MTKSGNGSVNGRVQSGTEAIGTRLKTVRSNTFQRLIYLKATAFRVGHLYRYQDRKERVCSLLKQIPGAIIDLVMICWTFRTDTHSLNSYLIGVDDREVLKRKLNEYDFIEYMAD